MGLSDGPSNARPAHEGDARRILHRQIRLVTNAQYLGYVEATGSERPQFIREEGFNQPDQPVVGLVWNQARDYCQWAGLQLPSEAQWELTAAGTDGRVFPWGNAPADESLGNFNFSSGPTPVGSYPEGASPFGALDMAGNVWEWTLDEYQHTYYANSPVHNPVNLKNAGMEDGPDSHASRRGLVFGAAQCPRVCAEFGANYGRAIRRCGHASDICPDRVSVRSRGMRFDNEPLECDTVSRPSLLALVV